MDQNEEDTSDSAIPNFHLFDLPNSITVEANDDDDNETIVRSVRMPIGGSINSILRSARSRFHGRNTITVVNTNSSHGFDEDDDDDDDDDDNELDGDGETFTPQNAQNFDTELPAEHLYLGSMSRVSGVNYLEVKKPYRLMIVGHYALVFPGEILPMIMAESMFGTYIGDEGLFGLVFNRIYEETKPNLYGVTCQIFEKGDENDRNLMIKCRVLQRFVIRPKDNANFPDFLTTQQQIKIYANVEILPEIHLPDPLGSIDMGCLNKFRNNSSVANKVRNMQAATTPWPRFVYEQYNMSNVIENAKKCLKSYKISTMPTDPVQLSFWLARNLVFNMEMRVGMFLTNSVNDRMAILGKYLNETRIFVCGRCGHKIGNCSELFAMSKSGVQTNYCNPSGFIHETNTVYSVIKDSVYPSGKPSTTFSWFPGYSWQIILCSLCNIHIGWKFSSPNLLPQSFFGLSGSNVKVHNPNDGQPVQSDPVPEQFRIFYSRSGVQAHQY